MNSYRVIQLAMCNAHQLSSREEIDKYAYVHSCVRL